MTISSEQATVDQRIRHVLSAFWQIPGGEEISKEIQSRVVIRPRSDCISCVVPAAQGKPPAFIKIFSTTEALDKEVRGLQYAASVRADVTVSTPGILEIIPAERAVLLEYVKGTTLDTLTRRQLVDRTALPDQCWFRLGTWLRRFHEADRVESTSEEFIAREVSRLDGYLAPLEGTIDPRLFGKTRALRDRLLHVLPKQEMRLVRCHGDFALPNVLVNRQGLRVIDFAYAQDAPPEYDFERLWSSLEDAIGFFPGTRSLDAAIRQSFMAGYGRQEFQRSVVSYLVAMHLRLEKVYFLSSVSDGSPMKRIWRSYQLRHTIRGLWLWVDASMKEHAA